MALNESWCALDLEAAAPFAPAAVLAFFPALAALFDASASALRLSRPAMLHVRPREGRGLDKGHARSRARRGVWADRIVVAKFVVSGFRRVIFWKPRRFVYPEKSTVPSPSTSFASRTP